MIKRNRAARGYQRGIRYLEERTGEVIANPSLGESDKALAIELNLTARDVLRAMDRRRDAIPPQRREVGEVPRRRPLWGMRPVREYAWYVSQPQTKDEIIGVHLLTTGKLAVSRHFKYDVEMLRAAVPGLDPRPSLAIMDPSELVSLPDRPREESVGVANIVMRSLKELLVQAEVVGRLPAAA